VHSLISTRTRRKKLSGAGRPAATVTGAITGISETERGGGLSTKGVTSARGRGAPTQGAAADRERERERERERARESQRGGLDGAQWAAATLKTLRNVRSVPSEVLFSNASKAYASERARGCAQAAQAQLTGTQRYDDLIS
jgi:hypothetical protein